MKRPVLTLCATGVSTAIVLVMGGKTFVQYKIAKAMSQEKYYTKTMELFDKYPIGVDMVGVPYKERQLFIQDIKRNWTDGANARIMIQIVGKKDKALIHSWAHRRNGMGEWMVDKCDMEVKKKRWTFYINPLSKNMFTVSETGPSYQEYPPGWIQLEHTRKRLDVDCAENSKSK